MKKIGLLIDTLIGGGAERIVLNFAETFAKFGHEVHIILIKDVIEHEINPTLYTIHTLSHDGELSKYKFINKILLAQRLKKVVATIETNAKPFDLFISNAEDMDLLAKKAKLKNFYIRYRNSMFVYYKSKFEHTSGFKRLRRKLKFKLQFKSRYDNQNIITVSKALVDDITKQMNIKPRMIQCIYNPFDFETIRKRAEEENLNIPKEKYIIYAAKFENRKNQKLLVKAYKKANTPLPLVLIGNTHTSSDKQYLKELKDLIKELGIEDKIIFPGFQKNPYPWIKNAELFVMSSNSEGLPLVLVEALVLGTKIVSTDCPTGPSEVLVDELKEFLSPVGDIEGLANNIQKALESYPKIEDKYIEKFKASYSIEQYLQLCAKGNS
ncbi:glycosyltransferase [Sulfurospirillum sp. 1612]|uniref:glycosyltransferase n=1 Tax=Sulfurospirillum sp. 1612 TaxID=3094835 RepID=UPI002F939102